LGGKMKIEIKKLEEKFNCFIKKWCGNYYPHLIDADENA
jgi:hypothetical protein